MPPHFLRTVAIDGAGLGPRPPGRRSETEIGRDRKYLTPAEVDRLITTAKKRGRYGQRDALAILMAYRHGLRVSELVNLCWSQISWDGTARLTVKRRKGSISGMAHPLQEDELRPLRRLQKEQLSGTQFIFMGEPRNGVSTRVSIAWFQRMLRRVGVQAGLPLVHAHQLRHSTGFALADRGRDLREIQLHLGHKSISNTTQYVDLRPSRLDHIWS